MDTLIQSFEIKGLHGDKDIGIYFKNPHKILISENGSGKTTVLNSLFYLLSGQFQKLSGIDFESVWLKFDNGCEVHLNKESIYQSFPEEAREHSSYLRLVRMLGEELADKLLNEASSAESEREIRFSKGFMMAKAAYDGPTMEILHHVRRLSRDLKSLELLSPELDEVSKVIKDNFDQELIYLPTYRRVEEDLHRLGYEGDFSDSAEQLIHFGMRDVSRRFRQITESIRESSVSWYSKISGRMLDELMDGTLSNRESRKINFDLDALEIVLDRIGRNINKDRKSEIINLVTTGNINDDRYKVMVYFLSNLVEIYEQQREKDNKIKDFVNSANKYLVNKEIIYDESDVRITIVNTRTGAPVELDKLSSGEKQLVSILSKLYLDSGGPNFIIFDEPELSLSIDWQRQLLPDIIASGKCRMLLAATHSPFIFDNDLDQNAEALEISYRDVIDESVN